jgi:hypothetical protein
MAGATGLGKMSMILSRNISGRLCINDKIPAAIPESRGANLQRMDQCLSNGEWRAYRVQRVYQDPAATLPVTGVVSGILHEWRDSPG